MLTRTPNPPCPHCQSLRTVKNNLLVRVGEGEQYHRWSNKRRIRVVHGVEIRGYYRCRNCLKFFVGTSYKLTNKIYDGVPNCHKCGIGRPAYRMGGHNTSLGRAETYRCRNCGQRYTVSPCMGANNPRLRRKISAKECLRLRTEEFLSYGEIAQIAGVQSSTIKALLGNEVIPDW